jgi:hypothetical protein
MGPCVALAARSAAAAASGSGQAPKPGGERCGQARERSAYSCVAGGLSASAERARRSEEPSSGQRAPVPQHAARRQPNLAPGQQQTANQPSCLLQHAQQQGMLF